MSRGAGFRDFANPCAWTNGEHLGVLLPDDDTKLPVLHRHPIEPSRSAGLLNTLHVIHVNDRARGLVQRAEVVDGLLRVHPASADGTLTKLHMGHHDRAGVCLLSLLSIASFGLGGFDSSERMR